MRVTEQIDAMEIMGVNSANFLILPKILGLMLFIPVLSIISMATGLVGGYIATYFIPSITPSDFEMRRFNYQMQLNWFHRASDKKAVRELGSLVSCEVCY